jgi:hypothetical protein
MSASVTSAPLAAIKAADADAMGNKTLRCWELKHNGFPVPDGAGGAEAAQRAWRV